MHKDFGERTRTETDPRFGDWLSCPECGKEGREHMLRNHLREQHGWSQPAIEERYGESPINVVSGPSSPPISEDQQSPSYDVSIGDSQIPDGDLDELDYEKVKTESDLCDCDPKHKETQTVQRKKGGKIGPFGGQRGDGTTVIICTKCGSRFYESDDSSLGPGILWDGDGPGPL